METSALVDFREKESLYKWAYVLALITIFYNIGEGIISVLFGLEDDTMALFGFGLDSFVEVISGIGILHMVIRIRKNNTALTDTFERRALKITGTAFYFLTSGLIIAAIINLLEGHKPQTTLWGIIVSSVSIVSMWILIHYKVSVGTKLASPALIADAQCTKTCLYLSVVLLTSSAGYELTGLGGLDSAGTLAIAVLSFREGREAFQKARGSLVCGCTGSCH